MLLNSVHLPSHSLYSPHRLVWPSLVQFIFTVKKAACPSCPALHFTSNTTLGVFSGLTPNTTVSSSGVAPNVLPSRQAVPRVESV